MSKVEKRISPPNRPSLSSTVTPNSHKSKRRSLLDSFNQALDSPIRTKPTDDINDQPAGMLNSISAKARELKYSLQEWLLMKSIVFSLVVFLAFVMLTHFILNLAGEYLPVLILSVLASIALRPTKEALSSSIKDFLGITASQNHNTSFFRRSFVIFIYRSIKDLVYYKQNTQLSRKRRQKIGAFLKHFSPTGDIYAILIACILWISISRFGIVITLYIIAIIFLVDIVFRLLLDFLTFLTNQSNCLKRGKSQIQKNKEFSMAIDSTVATSVLLIFLILSVGFIIFMLFLLLVDIQTIVFNLRSSITLFTQNINQKLADYYGIENAIDEGFVTSFFKNYNESIYSYLENQELKGVYVLFSGLLNPAKNETASSFGDFPTLGDNTTEFYKCMQQNRLNSNLEIARNLEALYCTILPYAGRFTIDPLSTLKKIKEGFLFVFQLLFGTILFEVYLISKAALDYMFNVMIFCFCVYYLLHANKSAIYSATSLLPFDPKVRSELHDALVKSIKGSFLCSIKIFIYHFLLTWLAFDILQLKLGFTISIAASIFSILPFIPSWCLCIPHAIYLFLGRDNPIAAILFPVLYLLVSNTVYNDIYKKSIDIHPYVTGLSIVMGIYAFNVQGIIYGPLLMCITLIVIEMVRKYGISTDTMLKIHRKRIIIDKLDSLERLYDNRPRDRKRSRSSDIISPFKY